MNFTIWAALRENVPSFGKTTFPKKKFKFYFLKNSKKSVSYQENGGRGPAHLPFFWYDNDSGH